MPDPAFPDPALHDANKTSKPPVVRGARACSVCRAAKMKCVGGEEGVRPCQRCKRSGADCVFEKHRRGRKPGSKLSEASRVLRHLEKGLSDAKLKSQTCSSPPPQSASHAEHSFDRFPNNELPPLNLPPDYEPGPSRLARPPSHYPTAMEVDEADGGEVSDRSSGDGMYPAQLIRKETERTSFFKTILNPEPTDPPSSSHSHLPPPRSRSPSLPPANYPLPARITPELKDPISAGIIDEPEASVFFDLFFLRLNPFINLFDPALHSVQYVRSRCPFLFTTIIMVCCKFFKPNLYQVTHQMASDFALRAFAENWKRVEVAQAFACLTYWKEPDDTRTWTYIGYASRLAIELGLNRYVGKRPGDENEVQFRERRNRERTYFVLFVHDRSLSIQTGRQWMLSECELVRHSTNWHTEGALPVRPEDVIVAAFVQLQRIASESTDAFHAHKNAPLESSQEDHLRLCNGKLSQWSDTWQHEMRRAGGDKFHYAILNLFRLHIRLFLNSFGVQASMSPSSHVVPSGSALAACYSSALEILQIVVKDLASMTMLRYSQDSVTIMTAYAAVFLLKLLRSANTVTELHEGAAEEIHSTIFRVAEAYYDISKLSGVMVSAAHHARFLRGLVEEDAARLRVSVNGNVNNSDSHRRPYGSPSDSYRSMPSASSAPPDQPGFNYSSQRLPGPLSVPPHKYGSREPPSPPSPPDHNSSSHSQTQTQIQTQPTTASSSSSSLRRGTSVDMHAYPSPSPSHSDSRPPPASESDHHYWQNMFRDLGMEGSGSGYTHTQTHTPSPTYGSGKGVGAGVGAGLLPPLGVGVGAGGKASGYGGHHEDRNSGHGRSHPGVYGYNADHGRHQQQPYASSAMGGYPSSLR
ncbi:hypothetical protein EIP91_003955 [Steccherinum ochraceum]|uniref:Zn(2)-C6 fungal-type domain-containing protein n=1 Tax=Steccherinum ochraceum TaxID=92696 RepID=A0A4R0RRA7_9APHY|nr:hypothetical protein EIP91_003955 [Steccherinum ochraceum]